MFLNLVIFLNVNIQYLFIYFVCKYSKTNKKLLKVQTHKFQLLQALKLNFSFILCLTTMTCSFLSKMHWLRKIIPFDCIFLLCFVISNSGKKNCIKWHKISRNACYRFVTSYYQNWCNLVKSTSWLKISLHYIVIALLVFDIIVNYTIIFFS